MYSGSSLKPLKVFDAWFGAHQKIDRLAHRHLMVEIGDPGRRLFPDIKSVVEFEGYDGPDGIKLKTPAQGEPWHYYNPLDDTDKQILDLIKGNYHNLVKALKSERPSRASFEAAWLAHAIVDGLTPAHHYPYEEELERLRGGQSKETRTTKREKVIMHGDTMREMVKNNWGMWGDKGLLSTHMAFEIGVAVLIVPTRLSKQMPNAAEIRLAESKDGYLKIFQKKAADIAGLNLYAQFYKAGWTPKLARQIRKDLLPMIVDTVMLAWYAAYHEANKKR